MGRAPTWGQDITRGDRLGRALVAVRRSWEAKGQRASDMAAGVMWVSERVAAERFGRNEESLFWPHILGPHSCAPPPSPSLPSSTPPFPS